MRSVPSSPPTMPMAGGSLTAEQYLEARVSEVLASYERDAFQSEMAAALKEAENDPAKRKALRDKLKKL